MAAAAAATAAMEASTDAQTAVDRLDAADYMGMDVAKEAVARNAAMRAATGYSEAMGASADAHDPDATLDTAQAAQDDAEEARDDAVAAKMQAEMYSNQIIEYVDEANALSGAQMMARAAATAARMKATTAQEHADNVAELVGSLGGMPGESAVMAQTHAGLADTAAEMAEAAATSAEALMHGASEQAMMFQTTAETQRDEADDHLVITNELRREAQVASDVSGKQNEARDLAAARKAAGEAAGDARMYATAARTAADSADGAADTAEAAATRAMNTRTDYTNTKAKADAARMAANDAETAAMAAETAADMAEAALGRANADDATAAMAEMEQETAETQLGIAMTQKGTAEDEYGDAKIAMGEATNNANVHVVGLFTSANAHNLQPPGDPANTEAEELVLLRKAREAQIAAAGTAIMTVAADADNSAQTATATAAYPYDSNGFDVEGGEGEGMLSITVTVDAAAQPFVTEDDADTDDDERTAKMLPGGGLGNFMHGYETKRVDGDDTTHTVVFSDIEQQKAPRPELRIELSEVAVTDPSRITTDTVNPGESMFTGMYDHDGDSDTDPVDGTFTCDENCSVTHQDGEVTSISGYTFTGELEQTRMEGAADTDYLVFGIWLTETDPTDAVASYTGGAFHGGMNATVAATIEGKATYDGSAAGMVSGWVAGKQRVDYFQGTATLNADFGDDNVQGKVTGSIHTMTASGGQTVPTINLHLSDQDLDTPEPNNINTQGEFSGRTVMGDAHTVGDDGERDYTYTGMWAGQFYTPGETPAEDAPMAAAGTFGATGGDADDETEMSVVGAFGARQ